MFFGYSEGYFNLIGKSLNDTFSDMYRVFESINDKYHKFHKKQQIKVINI